MAILALLVCVFSLILDLLGMRLESVVLIGLYLARLLSMGSLGVVELVNVIRVCLG